MLIALIGGGKGLQQMMSQNFQGVRHQLWLYVGTAYGKAIIRAFTKGSRQWNMETERYGTGDAER
jgi:hypothetical protein